MGKQREKEKDETRDRKRTADHGVRCLTAEISWNMLRQQIELKFTHLRCVDLPGGDAHLLVVSELHRVYDLVVVRADVAHQLLVLPVFAQQTLHFTCGRREKIV